MSANFVLLEKITVGSAGASSVTFSSIPQTGYTDLKIVMSGRSNYGNNFGNPRVTFNGSATSFSRRSIYAENGSVGSEVGSDGRIIGVIPDNATANTFGSLEIYIPNYTSSNYKSYSVDSVTENNSTTQAMWLLGGLWSNTAAITSISIAPIDGSFVQYSTFYLYGVAKLGTTPAIVPYATGGDTIMTDGTYWYHTFLSSGTFTPAKGLSCDVLAVAGGGGAQWLSGGGGAGGVYYTTGNSLTTTGYTVTIGGGGSGGGGSLVAGNAGSNSSFASLIAYAGGGGGAYSSNATAGTYGSGGGGGYTEAGGGARTGAAGTSGQGNTGGTTIAASKASAGGGGAGATGSNTTANTGGAGGAGVNTYSAWLSATGLGVSGYIGGGGGGTGLSSYGAGGAGGGGTGAANDGGSGIANTGGGGGASYNTNGGSGGSGLVIVRYAV